MIVSFAVQKLFSFIRLHLLIVGLNDCATTILFNNSVPNPLSSSLFAARFSIRFRVSDIMLRSLMHLEVSLAK